MLRAIGQLEPGEDTMRKRTLWAVALGIVLGLAGCGGEQSEEKPAGAITPPVVKAEVPDPFHARLLQIAGEYESYGKADRDPHVGPYLCRLVKNVDYPPLR